MTPKEKANEIVHKFKKYVDFTNEKDHTCLKTIILNSKQCALIAVDEIIKTLTPPCLNEFSYWQEVKNEIEKL